MTLGRAVIRLRSIAGGGGARLGSCRSSARLERFWKEYLPFASCHPDRSEAEWRDLLAAASVPRTHFFRVAGQSFGNRSTGRGTPGKSVQTYA
jgi:hypothetical protein